MGPKIHCWDLKLYTGVWKSVVGPSSIRSCEQNASLLFLLCVWIFRYFVVFIVRVCYLRRNIILSLRFIQTLTNAFGLREILIRRVKCHNLCPKHAPFGACAEIVAINTLLRDGSTGGFEPLGWVEAVWIETVSKLASYRLHFERNAGR